ncbi:MAG: hypothetical protein BroJett015_05020 [Chloroflexota bacterium]|nr:MAG: hypothetical protein BroJett015_05020 [Chloroflexota bacterium]
MAYWLQAASGERLEQVITCNLQPATCHPIPHFPQHIQHSFIKEKSGCEYEKNWCINKRRRCPWHERGRARGGAGSIGE